MKSNEEIKTFKSKKDAEIQEIKSIMGISEENNVNDKEICIDATGFLIPDLLFLIRYLNSKGVNHLDIIYTEPLKYKKAED